MGMVMMLVRGIVRMQRIHTECGESKPPYKREPLLWGS